jgi:hypothetical protein
MKNLLFKLKIEDPIAFKKLFGSAPNPGLPDLDKLRRYTK